jgi:hypothetical protein
VIYVGYSRENEAFIRFLIELDPVWIRLIEQVIQERFGDEQ